MAGALVAALEPSSGTRAFYSSMARESIKSDPLDFWKCNEKKFPLLAEAARKFLSPPATSVPSEQVFSTARDVFTYRRMSIGPKKSRDGYIS
ncbi:hypothetical protein ACQ4LE_004924 [Meloidogyne hapla]